MGTQLLLRTEQLMLVKAAYTATHYCVTVADVNLYKKF